MKRTAGKLSDTHKRTEGYCLNSGKSQSIHCIQTCQSRSSLFENQCSHTNWKRTAAGNLTPTKRRINEWQQKGYRHPATMPSPAKIKEESRVGTMSLQLKATTRCTDHAAPQLCWLFALNPLWLYPNPNRLRAVSADARPAALPEQSPPCLHLPKTVRGAGRLPTVVEELAKGPGLPAAALLRRQLLCLPTCHCR